MVRSWRAVARGFNLATRLDGAEPRQELERISFEFRTELSQKNRILACHKATYGCRPCIIPLLSLHWAQPHTNRSIKYFGGSYK
jgi:hypothetical protein